MRISFWFLYFRINHMPPISVTYLLLSLTRFVRIYIMIHWKLPVKVIDGRVDRYLYGAYLTRSDLGTYLSLTFLFLELKLGGYFFTKKPVETEQVVSDNGPKTVTVKAPDAGVDSLLSRQKLKSLPDGSKKPPLRKEPDPDEDEDISLEVDEVDLDMASKHI